MIRENDMKHVIKLDPEKKRIWVEALRSGDYKQTSSYLKTSKGMCCLGVYADAVEHVEWFPTDEVFSETEKDQSLIDGPFSFNNGNCVTSIPGDWVDRKATRHLIDLNDIQKKDFNAIADWVEEHL